MVSSGICKERHWWSGPWTCSLESHAELQKRWTPHLHPDLQVRVCQDGAQGGRGRVFVFTTSYVSPTLRPGNQCAGEGRTWGWGGLGGGRTKPEPRLGRLRWARVRMVKEECRRNRWQTTKRAFSPASWLGLPMYICCQTGQQLNACDGFFQKVMKRVLVALSCLTLCGPMNCSPPGSSVHGIFQAGILEWIAIPFSSGSSWPRDWTRVSCIAGRFFTAWATREIQ